MALKIEVNSLDEIDAVMRPHYEKIDDGRYRLMFDGLDKLKNSEQVERGRRKAAESRVKELETQVANLRTNPEASKELTPRERFIRENAKRLNGLEGDAYAAEFAKIEQEMQPVIDTEVAETATQHQARLESMNRTIRTEMIKQSALRVAAEISQSGSAPVLLPLITARLGCEQRGDEWTVFVTDDAGKPTAASLDALKDELRIAPAFRPLIRGVTEGETAAHARKVQAAISPKAAH